MKGYFQKNILPLLQGSSSELAKAHSLFRLSAANNGVMPVSKYFEADITILGFSIPCVGFLMVKDPNTLLEPQHTTQLPGVVRLQLNLVLGVRSSGGSMGLILLRNSVTHKTCLSSCSFCSTLFLLSIRASYKVKLILHSTQTNVSSSGD